MTAVVPAPRPRALALGRGAAALAVASAGVHLLQLDGGSFGALLTATMALACLPCAWHLWRAPTTAAWTLTAAVDVGMLLMHAGLMAHHSDAVGLMRAGMALVVAQLVLAGGAALSR